MAKKLDRLKNYNLSRGKQNLCNSKLSNISLFYAIVMNAKESVMKLKEK